jgi:pilus assembly protein CpaF
VAGCVDIVVHLATDHSGSRTVRQISAVSGRVESGVVEMADVFSDHGGGLVRAGGFPPHEDRFERLGFDLGSLLGGPADPRRPS